MKVREQNSVILGEAVPGGKDSQTEAWGGKGAARGQRGWRGVGVWMGNENAGRQMEWGLTGPCEGIFCNCCPVGASVGLRS